MYTRQPKKLLILNILEILQWYSDEEHRLSQREIGEILRKEYSMTANRKAIRRNLSDLIDNGFPIEHSDTIRLMPVKDEDGQDKLGPDGAPLLEENVIYSDFYLEHRFIDGELRPTTCDSVPGLEDLPIVPPVRINTFLKGGCFNERNNFSGVHAQRCGDHLPGEVYRFLQRGLFL